MHNNKLNKNQTNRHETKMTQTQPGMAIQAMTTRTKRRNAVKFLDFFFRNTCRGL